MVKKKIVKVGVLEDLLTGQTYELPKRETVLIGRNSEKCDIVISKNYLNIAKQVSRVHAAVRYDEFKEKYEIVDVLPSYGTKIRNSKGEKNLHGEKAELENNTRIMLAGVYPFLFYEKQVEEK